MTTSKQDKTKWTVTNLKTGGVSYFNTEEGARSYALSYPGCFSVRAPIYR
jgi:hypothetical protein